MRLVRHFDALNAWDPVIPWDKSDTVVLVGKREGEPAIAVKEWSAERMQRSGGDIQVCLSLCSLDVRRPRLAHMHGCCCVPPRVLAHSP